MTGKSRFFLFVFISCISVTLYAADWPSVISEYGPGIAKIAVKNDKGVAETWGTGFVIEIAPGEVRMVTNAHVVAGALHVRGASISARFLYPDNNTEQEVLLDVDFVDTDLDLCLLKLEADEAPAVLELEDLKAPELMEEIIAVGYPLGKNFKTTPGYIQAFQHIDGMGDVLDLSAAIDRGNSGGPVLNVDGHVIGIITAIIPGANFNLAIPVKNLLSVVNNTGYMDVNINSEPDGARVFIDSEYKGKTPLSLNLLNREYKLDIEKDGFEVLSERVGPWVEGSGSVNMKLKEIVNTNPVIKIIVIPADADILINNKDAGEAPVTVQFPSGSILRIRVTAGGYREKLEFYEVSSEAKQEVEIELEKKFLFW